MSSIFSKLFLGWMLCLFIPGSIFGAQTTTVEGIVNEEGEAEAAPSGGGGMPAEWLNPPKPPFGILINNGAKYTNSKIVVLNLIGGPDAKRMAISNFSDFRDAGQEIYQTSKSWNLCQSKNTCPEGEYAVYVKFYTDWGIASEVVSGSIIYKKPMAERVIKQIQIKIDEISRKIIDLRKQIVQFFSKKEIVAEAPKTPSEEIVPPAEEIPPKEEIISPLREFPPEKKETAPIKILKEYSSWLWQKITSFWQKIWPF